MDIAGLSMALSQSQLGTNWGVAMMSKTMDTVQDQGADLVSMLDAAAMERSVNPDVGANIDIRV